MNPVALLGGLIVAVLGTVTWGLLAWQTGYNAGYLAWAIGAFVGFTMAKLRGRGFRVAGVAALLATLSMLGGRMFSVWLFRGGNSADALDKELSEPIYEKVKRNADDFALLSPADDHRGYMVAHGFSQAKSAAGVTDAELARFRKDEAQALRQFGSEKPSFASWKKAASDQRASKLRDPFVLAQVAISTLSTFDAILFLLGIGTAFQLVMAASRQR